MVFKRGKTWYATFKDTATGAKRMKAVGPERAVAVTVERELRRRHTLWTHGLYDPAVEQRDVPLEQHLEDFLRILEGGGISRRRGAPCETYVANVGAHLRTAFQHMRARVLADVQLGAVVAFLRDLEDGRVLSAARDRRRIAPASRKTRDSYAADLKSFASWAAREERLGAGRASPLVQLPMTFRSGDERRERMALSLDELVQLAEATAAGGDRADRNRAVLYLTAGLTGLRRAECRALTWRRVVHHAGGSFVSISGRQVLVAKNRREAEVPLVPLLADALRRERAEQARHFGRPVSDGDLVFPWMPTDSHSLPATLRRDAENAGIPTSDDEGRRLDFHALRGSCATILLASGVAPHLVQQVMRHGTLDLTLKHYTKVRRADLQAAVRCVGAKQAKEVRRG